MQSAPLVSIVLPTRNGERFLRLALDSCLEQTYSNWELIIVDDGSTDSTPDIIASYKLLDQRIRSIRHEQGRRLPGALNAGFAVTAGDLLTWTSDDNLYRPNAIEVMVAELTDNPAVGLVYAAATDIDDDGNRIGPHATAEPDVLANRNCIGACFMYRREVLDRIGEYAEDQFMVEDYDYWLRVSMLFNLKYLTEDLYLYRRHGGSLTAQNRQKILDLVDETLIRHLPSLGWIKRKDRALIEVRAARLAFRKRQFSRAVMNLAKAAAASPLDAVASGTSSLAASVKRRIHTRSKA